MMVFKEIEEVEQLVVIERVVAEIEYNLHGPRIGMLDNPPQVLELKVGTSHVPYDALPLEFEQGGQGFVGHPTKVGKLDVVHEDHVDIVEVHPFHALMHTAGSPRSTVIPNVMPVFAITSYLGGNQEFVAGNVWENCSQHLFCLIIAVIGRNIHVIDAGINGRHDHIERVVLPIGMENAPEGRASERNGREGETRVSQLSVFHIMIVVSM